MKKQAPKINTALRSHTIIVPECIRNASGIVINGNKIKSLIFSTCLLYTSIVKSFKVNEVASCFLIK